MATLNGGILRQRLRSSARDGVKLGHGSDNEYLSDDALDHLQKSKQPLIDQDEVSSPSQYESGSDSGEETTDERASASGTGNRPSDSSPSPRFREDAEGPAAESSDFPSNSKGWYEFDLSVVVALVSPIGNWLTGGDHVKNLLLILLLIFYLHQIIEVPWSLYHLSRPRRRSPQAQPKEPSLEDRYHQIASSELHNLELFYLTMTVLSPVMGALLLRTVITSVSGPTSISWFSTSLFVLATGMRPWKHAIERLRQRTIDLHDVIHYPSSTTQDTQSQVDALAERLALLEAELRASKDAVKALTEEVFDHVDDAIDGVEKIARKQEKKSEATRAAQEVRFARLEQSVESLLEKREISPGGVSLNTTSTRASLLLSAVTDQLAPILPAWTHQEHQEKSQQSPRSSPKTGRTRSGSKLETIPEGAVFHTKPARPRFTSIRIPGIHLILRIGDLATLPVRTIVRYLLAGRIYQPQIPLASPP